MLIFTDHIINSPLQTDVIYLDISKAFDTVSHSTYLAPQTLINQRNWYNVVLVQDLLISTLPTCLYK